jgi:hypothetical protein
LNRSLFQYGAFKLRETAEHLHHHAAILPPEPALASIRLITERLIPYVRATSASVFSPLLTIAIAALYRNGLSLRGRATHPQQAAAAMNSQVYL